MCSFISRSNPKYILFTCHTFNASLAQLRKEAPGPRSPSFIRRADSDPDKYPYDTTQHMKSDTASSDEADIAERKPARPERGDRPALKKALAAARDEGEYAVCLGRYLRVEFSVCLYTGASTRRPCCGTTASRRHCR